MTVYFYDTFIRDLHEHGDSNFAQRVVRKIMNPNGTFRHDVEDHRFDGIENAWIRYVSGGNTAYRAIYIREGEHIYLYRAGEHSIENNLGPPRGNRTLAEISAIDKASATVERPSINSFNLSHLFRQNGRGRLLRSFLLGRRLFPHKEIFLVSPFLSLDLLERTNRVGLALDQLREDGTKITLITRPPLVSELGRLRDLEVRGWDLFFHRTLHAKIYIFKVIQDTKYVEHGAADAALIGSANLTEKGFGLDEHNYNEELCYELPTDAQEGALDFIYGLALQSQNLDRVRHALSSQRS
jgi:phosphatidylserine/phosphatidylglycerophosphate/cardiolipin synthase-like enzyme